MLLVGMNVGAARSGWIISCLSRTGSLNEWHVGQAHLVTMITIGSSVTARCLLSLFCWLNLPVVDVNGACLFHYSEPEQILSFCSKKSVLTLFPGSPRGWTKRWGLASVPVLGADPSEPVRKITMGTMTTLSPLQAQPWAFSAQGGR